MIILKKLLGKNEKSGKLELFASTQAEVPSLGEQTAHLIPNFKNKLEPGSMCFTADFHQAILDTHDHWVWEGEYDTFQVYHSGRPASEAVETIQITPYIEANGYDLTTHRTKGTYYGGYALASGVTTSEDAYDGANWTWSTMETADGTHLSPVADTMYYVREMPSAYLRATILAFNSGSNITDFRPLSDLPDTNGANLGWIFNDMDEIAYYGFYQSVTWVGITHTVVSEFGEHGAKAGGWLFSAKGTTIAPYMRAGASLKVVPWLLTDDGVKVVSRAGFVIFWGELKVGTIWGHGIPDPEVGW